jgi:transcriptional regulator GlxA family with amidase domain
MIHTTPLRPDNAYDMVIVPAIWRHPRWVLRHYPEYQTFLQRQAAADTIVCSVGTGSFVTASAGLLDEREATTHWQWLGAFRQQFPKVTLRSDQLITQSERFFCCGSVNSIADLMVYFCGEFFSASVAQSIENQFSPEIRNPFTPSQISGSSDRHGDELIAHLQSELRNDVAAPLALVQRAAQYQLSVRSLQRRFRAATGTTPSHYQKALRLKEARSLLHRTNMPISEVGFCVGYADGALFAREFKLKYQLSPRAYRKAVRGKLFTLAPLESMDD